jgi:cytochrome c2
MSGSKGMENDRALWRIWPVVVLAIGMFVFGLATHKYKYFPYPQVMNVVRRLTAQVPGAVLQGQYSRDRETLPIARDVDTALLPLRIRGKRISDILPVPKVAGAIATVGNRVVVMDRLGDIYSSATDGHALTRLPFPPLPNQVADYLNGSDARLDEDIFRAYDIEFVRSAKAFAVAHEYFDAQSGRTRLAVSVILIDEQTLKPDGSWKTIFVTDEEPNGSNVEAGGRLASKGEQLYLTVGAYGDSSLGVAQDPQSSFGKIIEIDIRTRKHKTVSIGHRNPEGLLVTQAGQLLSTEHGPKGGDEVNLITEGANYGWPQVTLGTDYATYSWPNAKLVGDHGGYQAPLFAWVPSIAVSNLIQVTGFNQRWDGDLLVASLKAETLFRLRLDGTRVLYAEPIWIGQRIRDVAQLEDGTIVLWTDDTQLLFISVDNAKLANDTRVTVVASNALDGACLYCHHFGPTNAADFAPTLSDLFTRKIASDNFRYSSGLRNKEGVWTEEALRRFLHNPAQFANGTGMPTPHLRDDQLDEVIEALKQFSHPSGADIRNARLGSPDLRLATHSTATNHQAHGSIANGY